ncbi:MAG: hypothetical protein JO200_11755 [Comamonas sp.]|nr:hypothetical protein [Comamonas sp.]
MNFFEEATLRLKQQLRATQDKEIALMLGLSAQSWAGRKKRGSFPEKELRALMQQRPELGLDVDYVLTGEGMRHITGQQDSKGQALADAVLTAGEAAAGRKEKARRAVMGKPSNAQNAVALTAGVSLIEPAEQADEARLLAAFRASNSAGRAAILLAAQGIAELSQRA